MATTSSGPKRKVAAVNGLRGAWRAPSNNTNTFARESHIDILAAAAGVDPLEFRLKNLKDRRMRRVLEALAEKVGWKPAPPPSGRGLGIATGIDAGTYVAHMAEVEVDIGLVAEEYLGAGVFIGQCPGNRPHSL